MLEANATVYGRYELTRIIERFDEYQLWEARDEYGGPLLVKAWPYDGEKPTHEERALWNVELRHLFRLASLPEAEEHLVVLKDAGIDSTHKCFIMTFMAPGLCLLEDLLVARGSCEWLRNARAHTTRAELWRGVRRLSLGLNQLHQQQMLHRAISTKSVLVDRLRGPSTMRLSGFEWTVRLGGNPPAGVPPLPPSEGTYSFASDWFLLGLLIARIFIGTDASTDLDQVITKVRNAPSLIADERNLIERLLTNNPLLRLSRGHEVIQWIGDILAVLDAPTQRRPEDYLALLTLLGPQRSLTLAVIEQDATISALDVELQRQFIEDDLSKPRIIRRQGSGPEAYTVLGRRLRYSVTEYLRSETTQGSWDLAYCSQPTELRSSAEEDQVTLEKIPIRVFTLRAFMTDESVVRRAAVSWKPYLPGLRSEAAGVQQRLHDFFRVTNQVELLMRDAEIFPYEIRDFRVVDGAEEIILRETPRAREVLAFAKTADNLVDFLNREQETRDGDLVYLGIEESLALGRQVPRTEFWNVIDINLENGILLRRPRRAGSEPPPPTGFLRSFGLFGQMSLIRRRKRAIERLGNHAYLLRALDKPDFVFLDSGEGSLPRKVDPKKIDEAKRSALASIWRTRPIFALQGPPGTGKTTLVANLLSQIFEEDPVAQVLVTAQAHAAVDVLREKVTKEIEDTANAPISIRLPRTKGDETPDQDYVEQVTHRMLVRAVNELGCGPTRNSIQARWLEVATEAMHALGRHDTEGHAKDLCELVRRSAGITYCTTTAGNLAELAVTTQTFDWSIIEEAGKAHGFDLVLPLQTGHRWLLIGDQKQLSPYRDHDFHSALTLLDATFEAIRELPERAGNLVDIDVILRWQKGDEAEKALCKSVWLSWLTFFDALHRRCSTAKLPTLGNSRRLGSPVLSEMLWQQHRMHPVIAELVSRSYYENSIESKTVDDDGKPLARVVHPFVEPSAIIGCAIVWLDTLWVRHGGAGEEEAEGRYTSIVESDAIKRLLSSLRTSSSEPLRVSILSPYRRQVSLLNSQSKRWKLPAWMNFRAAGPMGKRKPFAATVDSFQGDQADVVIVSLVRNNDLEPGKGLGFLREEKRMNVLFSRAERLLVLVGSWEFFQHQLEGVPADDTQPLGHWRIAMDYLSSCFDSHSAVLIDAKSIEELQ